MMPQRQRQRNHEGEDPESEDAGLLEALQDKRRDRLIRLVGFAEIARQDSADPFGVAFVEGHVEALSLEPALIVLIGKGRDRKAAELGDGDLLLELVAVEDEEQQGRDHPHDQQHLQEAASDQLEHGLAPHSLGRSEAPLPSTGMAFLDRRKPPSPAWARAFAPFLATGAGPLFPSRAVPAPISGLT